MKIVIAGSSGFIGTHLASHLEGEGHTVVQLSRNPAKPGIHYWDPEKRQIDPSVLEGAEVVINLSGESILGRWTPQKMEQIRDSRLHASQFLCDTLLSLGELPKLYIGASAIGFYGDRPQEVLDETSLSGHGYLAEVCRLWEAIPSALAARGVRVALTRFGIVLGDGGALKQMEKAFRMGLGGVLGSGEQMMSWIALDDVCGAISFLISHSEMAGPVNFVSPQPVSNLVFTQTIGKVLHRPTVVPVPKFALTMLFGAGAEIFLSSAQVQPRRLIEGGYPFQYTELEEVLKKYLILKV